MQHNKKINKQWKQINQVKEEDSFLSTLFRFNTYLIRVADDGKKWDYINEDLYSALISWPMIPILLGFYTLLTATSQVDSYLLQSDSIS